MTGHISDDGLLREETVAEHTEKTVYLCHEKGRRCGLARLMSLCGALHDMGKNKKAFDDYLHADAATRHKLRGTVAHASTGAKYLFDRYHDCSGSTAYMVEMISYAIASHHGISDCVDDSHTDLFSAKLHHPADYEEACANAERDYLPAYEPDRLFADASAEFDEVCNRLKSLFCEIKPHLLSQCSLFLLSCLQRLILSILIDADWEATSDFMADADPMTKPPAFQTGKIFEKAGEHFRTYMRQKRQPSAQSSGREKIISDARDALHEECRQFARHPAGIYCLPIPTGGGKTLGSLAYALEYCRLHPETERIIYVSPYISITEQNAAVFRDAIGNDSWLLEHHSSVLRNEDAETEDYRQNHFFKYDINWEEPFICTTFVQFMNTLFSDRSEAVRRMHRLVNSVVIIDEVQSMPLKCVHTFNYMINFLNVVCNTNIILCTATQPALAATVCPVCYSTPKYMIADAARWFEIFERVKISVPDLSYTLESLGEEIAAGTNRYRSILIVLNTNNEAFCVVGLLKKKGIRSEYLTTNLCAAHRSDKIASIKKILAEKQESVVVVSTNLIEAGVDISFECVYRSMAGLDSLAQTAGRCNRNGEMEYGILHLISLEDEGTGNMEELRQNMRTTREILDDYSRIENPGSLLAPRWMDEYYRLTYESASDKMNFPVEKHDTSIMQLLSEGFGPEEKKNHMNQAYKTAGCQYRLIDDCSFGVIVPYKKGAELIASIQDAHDDATVSVRHSGIP